jgi:genome maintenance exonuclease 1
MLRAHGKWKEGSLPAPAPEDCEALNVDEHWKSISHVLEGIDRVCGLEFPIVHRALGYAGTADCLAVYKGDLCLFDWKTAAQPKNSLQDCYDYPLQLAAYAGAINASTMFRHRIKKCAIVLAYPGGLRGHIHIIDEALCEHYWKAWLERLQIYKKKALRQGALAA